MPKDGETEASGSGSRLPDPPIMIPHLNRQTSELHCILSKRGTVLFGEEKFKLRIFI